MKKIITWTGFLSLCLSQTSADRYYKKITAGLSGTLSATHLFTPNTVGGFGRLQYRLGITDLFYQFPTYGDWAYNPALTGAVEVGILRGKSAGQAFSGVLALDLILRAGLYTKQKRTASSRPFLGGGIKFGILKNSLVAPAICLRMEYMQINDLRFDYQDPSLEVRYNRLDMVDASLGLGKSIYGFFPYLAIGYRYNMINGEYIQRALPNPEFVSYKKNLGNITALLGAEWNVLFFKLNSEILFSGANPGMSIGIGHGL